MLDIKTKFTILKTSSVDYVCRLQLTENKRKQGQDI